jgi:hypothetical protein
MEFLTLNDSLYSDEKQGQSNSDKVNIILSVVGQGLEVKTQTTLNDFVGGLTDSHKKYFDKVMKSKTSDQEKAIISALLNKYPKLKNNEAQQREFRKHVSNLLGTDKLNEGALKYLLERILEVDSQEKEKEQQEAEAQQPEQPQDEQPQAEQPQDEPAQEGAPQPAETQNSDTTYSGSLSGGKVEGVNLQRNTKALPGTIYKEVVKRNNYSGTIIQIPLKPFRSTVGQDNGLISPTIYLTFKTLDLSKVKRIDLKPLQLENQSSVYIGGRHNTIEIVKLNLKSVSNGYEVDGVISIRFSYELDDAQDEDFKFKTFLKVAKDKEYSEDSNDLDFYTEWEREFENKECELTEDDFNDMLDEEELDCYLSQPSHARMTSEHYKKNSLTKAEKFLESKREKFPAKEKTYSTLMKAEDFIASKLLGEEDTNYSSTRNTLIGGAIGTAAGDVTVYQTSKKKK